VMTTEQQTPNVILRSARDEVARASRRMATNTGLLPSFETAVR